MRIRTIAALSVATAFALACSDAPSPTSTETNVDLSFAKSTGGACSSTVSRTAKAQLQNLLAGNLLKQAQSLWAAVEGACSPTNADAANSQLFAYLNFVQTQYPANFITSRAGDKATLYAAHINTVFEFDGYASPGITKALLDNGIVGVIPSTGGTREYAKAHLGGFRLNVQDSAGDQRGHLFTMSSLPTTDCLSVDNLVEFGECVDLSSYPHVSPKWSPRIKVGICTEASHTAGAGSLGHETPDGTEVAGSQQFPSISQCHPNVVASWTASPRDFLKRLAWTAKRVFGTETAYATDAGIGGFALFDSPFGVLDAQIFAASFDVPPNVIGQPPVATIGNYTFTSTVVSPGSILVQSSLGNLTGPLVVLSQGGGNCASCGELKLTAHFFSASGTPADDGVYEITWSSVQASPSVKGAPFVVRDGAGGELARLNYQTVPNSLNQLTYNGVVVGAWVRNVAQNFKITVDLNNNTTSLSINGTVVATGNISASASLATFGAEFSGIDSGVMGVDEIGVRRIADQPQS